MRAARTSLSLGALCAVVACSRAPDDLREWRVSDHTHQSDVDPESAQGAPQVSGSAEPALPGLDEVTIASFRRNCATCHGQLGRGDGPQGPMVKARDLSDPAWQATITDAQIADAILKGRGRMPPSALPAATVDGLVHLVRLFNRARLEPPPPGAPGASASSSGAPAPAASATQ